MATVKTGVCPCCGKDRELAYFQFGVIKTTMCIYCIKRYIDSAVIPHLKMNNSTDDDKCLIVGASNE